MVVVWNEARNYGDHHHPQYRYLDNSIMSFSFIESFWFSERDIFYVRPK